MVSARMTDMEVMNYIQRQTDAGKSEQQIGRELVARGVTPEQVERIKAQYDSQSKRKPATSTATDKISSTRPTRTSQSGRIDNSVNTRSEREASRVGNISVDDSYGYDRNGEGDIYDQQPEYAESREEEREIFGHNVFSETNLTFAPGENLATPQNYRLGPGDEVIIDLWGENEEHIRQTISPEGNIMVAQLGPIYLSGKTVQEADKVVREKFSHKYGGVADARSDISLSLGQTRSIQVDVMGEVATPGTYQMSPFATVFHALYNAGGINDIGTLRNIEVLRGGKKVATVDIYDYLFRGRQNGNIRLQEGDVIIVSPYKQLVRVDGNVKRPMYYELKEGETVGNVINYAGGFAGDAYSDMVRVSRRNGRENELVNVEKQQYKTFRLHDGDVLTVGTIMDRYSNRVELRGAVQRPGMYALGTEIFTIRDLINKADGLLEDAYTGRVMLYREAKDLSLEVEAIDLGAILQGRAADIELRRNDMLVVSSVHELNDRGELTIEGEVARPGTYPYAAGATVEDLIVQAGGLLQGASTSRVEVSRRITDPAATEASDRLSEIYTLAIDKGLMVGEGSGFTLEPYDVVTIRRSPGYQPQEFVTVGGEIAFAGPYALTSRTERLSDVVKRAGGTTDYAYLKGASLIRRMTEEEIKTRRESIEMAQLSEGNDSISVKRIAFNEYYNVGINLEKALANPGSEHDIVLKRGDRLYIPELTFTVSIAGEVMKPNTVTYQEGKRVKDYIDYAGGYTDGANKKKVYIVYMNGNITKAKRSTPLEPGCQIIVPTKTAKKGNSFGEIMGYITSFASLGVMAASIASLLK